jgi:hypothetical protein
MQQSVSMNKRGSIWTFVLFLWNIRRVVSIILLALTLVYLFFSETLEQRRSMLSEFNQTQKTITAHETALKVLGDTVFSGPSRDGRSITTRQSVELYIGVQGLRSQLTAMTPPNADIEYDRDEYIRTLTFLQGRLNLFEEGAEGTTSVLEALDRIEIPAKRYSSAVKRYQSSVFRSLLAAF